MKLSLIANIVGSLFPIIFPKQEFKPKRAVFALVVFGVVAGTVNWIGVDATTQALEFTSEFLDLAEE